MNLAMEAVLQPLYKVELQSWIDDLAEDESEELKASHTEIIVDSLTNVKNCLSSWGVTIRDFFDKDKRSFIPVGKGKGKSKDQPKGGKSEQFPVVGEKAQGRVVLRIRRRNLHLWLNRVRQLLAAQRILNLRWSRLHGVL